MDTKMKSKNSACMELLKELIDLAKEAKNFKEALPGESEKVGKAILEIVVRAVICCDYIDTGAASREPGLMESQPKRFVPCPSKLLDFKPEGIDQVAAVKKLLDTGGRDLAMAVVIVGFGGIGKSTIAASAIQSLNLSDFIFSMVTVDENTYDKRSHILQLQSHIIFHFTGTVVYLQDPRQGREKLQKAMANKSCFLYIDNIVSSSYIKDLLPREFLPQNSHNHMQEKKIRILTTSRENDLKPLFDIKNVAYAAQKLSSDTAQKLLRRTILRLEEPAHDFDEERNINVLVEACKGVPLLLSVFGTHLKDNRDKYSYKEAIQALNDGNIDRYGAGDEVLSEVLMYVYDKMKDTEAQEAFLDICTYFHGRPWNRVAHIVGNATLVILRNKMLVNKSEAGTVIVHDILRFMGVKKGKDTRLANHEKFLDINEDESKPQIVKGMDLGSGKFLTTLETRQLNAMRHSLRILVLGDWVRVEELPCERTFENLRYLEVGDLKDFPFKDFSKMEKLNVFFNRSKPGMELAKLPPNLKYLSHIPYPDCNEFARLPLKNLKSLKTFMVQPKRSVKLPQGLKLPGSLEHLGLNSCEQLPETFGHLSALQTLALDKCDLKYLPQGFDQSVQLRSISMQHCTNMISLRDNTFGSLSSLTDLDLMGCTRLQGLPTDIGTLTALQKLSIVGCENLRVLPENFSGLKSLKTLYLTDCFSLQRLPDSFGMLRIEYLALESLYKKKQLPQSLGDLSCLKELHLGSCHSLEFVPDSFGQLTNLETLEVWDCLKLGALPKSFDQLCSLKEILWSGCTGVVDLPTGFHILWCLERLVLIGLQFLSLLDRFGNRRKLRFLCIRDCYKFQTLPQGFENLPTLEILELRGCRMLEGTSMDKIVKLQNCDHVHIVGSTKLINQWNEMEENNNLHMFVQTSWEKAV